jgi:hypothetical protein
MFVKAHHLMGEMFCWQKSDSYPTLSVAKNAVSRQGGE